MLKNVAELRSYRTSCEKALGEQSIRVLVCAGTGCVAGGSLDIYKRLVTLCEEQGLNVQVKLEKEVEHSGIGIKKSGCHGFCELGPLVKIEPMGWLYLQVKLEDCEEIVEKTLKNKEKIERLFYSDNTGTYEKQFDIPFYKNQTRIVLDECGQIDADSIDEYIAFGGYKAFERALFEMKPEEICAEIEESGLRGRGGGGYPAGRKWTQVLNQKEKIRYVVCNGDEGDPGAFMDRSIMEGNPHRMLEGMLIAGIATQAHEGYVYVRAEYPLAVERLKCAIDMAQQLGFLGKNILGTGFSFNIHINQGAGAFVCGEGSALTASIEGERGMPRVKPPRTVEAGLFAKPTVLNNVETYANVPLIISKGVDWYRSIGTETS
ncbi:MAG: NADH-quinone oxidoreductase subunit F, partial [Clostridia bacterium]|nr:NADH-quinone oxidoreductase subunit F [Clostridia bacterium]